MTRVVLPATAPEVINGIRIAVGFAWTTVVAAELNNGIPGIGGLAYLSGQQLNTALTIARIVVIGITALALDALIKWIGVPRAVEGKGMTTTHTHQQPAHQQPAHVARRTAVVSAAALLVVGPVVAEIGPPLSSRGPSAAPSHALWPRTRRSPAPSASRGRRSPTATRIVKDAGLLETCLPKAKLVWSKFSSPAVT